jgi:hypothetical protein
MLDPHQKFPLIFQQFDRFRFYPGDFRGSAERG